MTSKIEKLFFLTLAVLAVIYLLTQIGNTGIDTYTKWQNIPEKQVLIDTLHTPFSRELLAEENAEAFQRGIRHANNQSQYLDFKHKIRDSWLDDAFWFFKPAGVFLGIAFCLFVFMAVAVHKEYYQASTIDDIAHLGKIVLFLCGLCVVLSILCFIMSGFYI